MSTYSDKIIADGASNFWRLNEPSGTTAVDVIGGKNGTISGGVTLNQAGALSDGDKAMTFDGTTGQVSVPPSATTFGTGPFSLECWLKLTAPWDDGGDWILDTKHNGSGNQGVGIFLSSVNLATQVRTSGQAPDILATAGPTLGVWHHIVMTLSRGTTDVLSLYLDGALNGSQPCAVAGRNYTSTDGLMMAATNLALTRLACALDDVAIYPRALTPAEITAHYTLGTTPLVPSLGRDYNTVLSAFLPGVGDLTTRITAYLATLTGDYTNRWKQMEKNAGLSL